MEGEDTISYNKRLITLWETTKFCNKLCKTVKFEELSDDDKSCLTTCGANAAMEKMTLDVFTRKLLKNHSL